MGEEVAKLGTGKSEVKRGNCLNCHKLRGIIVKQPHRSLICLIICMKARLTILAAMCVVVVLNACGDPTSLRAANLTYVDTLSVYALSGSPPQYPNGVSVMAARAVQVDGFANFDVAFDVDASGNAVVFPPKLVVNVVGGGLPVGLQKLATSFESVVEAPNTGFKTDNSMVLLPGQTVVIQSSHNAPGDVCQFALSAYIYAKIAVDSVNVATRTVYLRMGVDPNCGFRSFVSGVPTS
jgi:hypothetical protein